MRGVNHVKSSCSCPWSPLLSNQNCNTSKRFRKTLQYRISCKFTKQNWNFNVLTNGRKGTVKPICSLLRRFFQKAPKEYQNNRCTNRDTAQRQVRRITAKLALSILIRWFQIVLLDRSLLRARVPRYCSMLCHHNAITKACQTTKQSLLESCAHTFPSATSSESKSRGWVGEARFLRVAKVPGS
jgi:hypothetical protein